MTGVNFTNIVRTVFAPKILRQKSTNLKCKTKKAANKTFVQKTARKMLVKLTLAKISEIVELKIGKFE
jgi:hypothetical protein